MNTSARAFAGGRIALGVTALLAPGPVSAAFGLGEGPTARLAGRYIGGRDLATGIGMLLAGKHGSARGWFEAAALIDFIDAGATVVAGANRTMPSGRAAMVAVLAGGSGAVALYLARTVDRPEEPGFSPTPAPVERT